MEFLIGNDRSKNLVGQMEESTKENGVTESRMEKETLLTRKENQKKLNGKMERR